MNRNTLLNWLRGSGLLTFASLLAGCEAKQTPAISTNPNPPPATAVSSPVENTSREAASIPLKVASWEQTKEIIASQNGKIVVLDLWSTYCPPCLTELPGLVKLHQQHGGEVVCLTLNCNFVGDGSPDENREEILKVLSEKKAAFQNLISSDADEVLYKKVGIASIPVVQVFDRSGKLSKQFDNEKDEYGANGFTYADHITPYVERLLKAASK